LQITAIKHNHNVDKGADTSDKKTRKKAYEATGWP